MLSKAAKKNLGEEKEEKNICRLIVVDRLLGEERKKEIKKEDDLLPYPYMCYRCHKTSHKHDQQEGKKFSLFSYKTLKSQFFYWYS